MALLEGLRGGGHEVDHYGDSRQQPDALVVLNHQPGIQQLQSRLGVPRSRTVLIVLEPRVTAPGMYQPRTLKLYGRRFAASPIWARRIGAEPFLWPQDLHQAAAPPGETGFAASLINADKRSAVTGSLYGLRRSVIRSLGEDSMPLAVFGPGWGDSLAQRLKEAAKAVARATAARILPNLGEALSDLSLRPAQWMGTVDEKVDAFAAAPTSIIIENSRDYVSEKLIDAVCAGVAPLYVGPPLSGFHLPREIAVECEPDAPDILATLRRMTPDRRAEVVAAGQQWLNSSESRMHDIRGVLRNLGNQIGDEL